MSGPFPVVVAGLLLAVGIPAPAAAAALAAITYVSGLKSPVGLVQDPSDPTVQGGWEEIDHEPAGAGGRNYGWRLREGAHPFSSALPPAYLPLVEPFLDYAHLGGGASVTGGFVYRGRLLGAEFYGRYFFADFVAGRVSAFGVDAGGELYIVNHRDGRVLLIVPPIENIALPRPAPAPCTLNPVP